MKNILFLFLITLVVLSGCQSDNIDSATAKQIAITTKTAKSLEKNPNRSLFWGDTHLHTTNSPDAFSFGARLTADDAYRFAKGEVIDLAGRKMQLSRPLDFLVIADHAEGLGLINEIKNEHPYLMRREIMRKWAQDMKGGPEQQAKVGREIINTFAAGNIRANNSVARAAYNKVMHDVWSNHLMTTEQHYDPGNFTTLIGYEWTSMPQGNNLHRVVIYRDGINKAIQALPKSAVFDSDPESLWKALDDYETNTGGKILAIPHNGNASNGLMFTLSDFEGNPMTKDYAQTRARWEPIVETTQIKGDSESHPFLSPNDEFSGYGDFGWDLGNLNLTRPKTNKMFEFEYSRGALRNGLLLEQNLGINPYKFGMIGSTDSHTAMATADSDNFSGKFSNFSPERALSKEDIGRDTGGDLGLLRFGWQYLASGYAAVWAENNSREAIWDAMKRKEVYGTTGPRIQLRFFGGWDFQASDVDQANYVSIGYEKGVPMGSDILDIDSELAPTFMIAASKDPEGAHLDRVQVIKGWVSDGETHEKIYDVAWSDNRTKDSNGKLPPVGNSVNIETATYTNDIGAPELTTVWTDPDFDADVRAFYYVRVLEIPTPRWTTYDMVRYGLELPEDIPRTVQERAYSSPIWYSPK